MTEAELKAIQDTLVALFLAPPRGNEQHTQSTEKTATKPKAHQRRRRTGNEAAKFKEDHEPRGSLQSCH